MKTKKILLLPITALLVGVAVMGACSTKKKQKATTEMNPPELPIKAPIGIPQKGEGNTPSNQGMLGGIGAGRPIPTALAPIVIYKTRGDYRELVPIQLAADGATIVSYPSRFDLGNPGAFTTPLSLEGGYLVDRRGVGPHTVFLKLTYAEYYALPNDPSASELLGLVLDKEPFTFLAVCDRGYFTTKSQEEFERYIAEGMPGAQVLIATK